MTITVEKPRRTGATNARVEMTRYVITEGERIIYAQRVDGTVRLTDVPGTRAGRCYLIESGLTVTAELQAIVEDYLDQADHRDAIPAVPA